MDTNEVRRLLKSVGAGYYAFLEMNKIEDAFLARMTYFHAVRKEYLMDPLDDLEEQASVLSHLDRWIAETEQSMRDVMPPPVLSVNLHVVTKR